VIDDRALSGVSYGENRVVVFRRPVRFNLRSHPLISSPQHRVHVIRSPARGWLGDQVTSQAGVGGGRRLGGLSSLGSAPRGTDSNPGSGRGVFTDGAPLVVRQISEGLRPAAVGPRYALRPGGSWMPPPCVVGTLVTDDIRPAGAAARSWDSILPQHQSRCVPRPDQRSRRQMDVGNNFVKTTSIRGSTAFPAVVHTPIWSAGIPTRSRSTITRCPPAADDPRS
jgi:hypothetical protein